MTDKSKKTKGTPLWSKLLVTQVCEGPALGLAVKRIYSLIFFAL
jgi:hypothetical protein